MSNLKNSTDVWIFPYKRIFWLLEWFFPTESNWFLLPRPHHIADIVRKNRCNNVRIVMSYGYPNISGSNSSIQQSPTRLQLIYSGNLDYERGVLNFY